MNNYTKTWINMCMYAIFSGCYGDLGEFTPINVFMYMIAAATATIDQPITLLSTVALMCCLILYKVAVVTLYICSS